MFMFGKWLLAIASARVGMGLGVMAWSLRKSGRRELA